MQENRNGEDERILNKGFIDFQELARLFSFYIQSLGFKSWHFLTSL